MKILEVVSTLGPSRRARVTVIEMVLSADAGESASFDEIAEQLQQHLPEKLEHLSLPSASVSWNEIIIRPKAIARIAGLICHMALSLQNAAGHKLLFHDFLQDQDPLTGQARYRFIFEHDDIPGGEQSFDLAMHIATEICPKLHWQVTLHDADQSLKHSISEFILATRPMVTPPESLGLIAAAQARQIPVFRLEREPYGALPAGFRVAPNGMIMLGHSRHRVIMDGLFGIDRPGPGYGIMNDRLSMWRLLASLDVPRPVNDPALLIATTLSRARRIARRLGFPVKVRPVQRVPDAASGWQAESEAELELLFSRLPSHNSSCMIEPVHAGQTLQLIYAGGKILQAKLDDIIVRISPDVEMVARKIEQAMNAGFLLIQMKIDPSGIAGESQAFVVTDLDPAPQLVTLLDGDEELLNRAYQQFLDCLYPPGTPCRIPIVSVTGTNGKTTTCTMIASIASAESLCVGMARTTGVYIDGQLKEYGDLSGFYGHCQVFESPNLDLAVLETARGDVLRSGFAFDNSNVAVCTNVTADHIGQHGIDTLEQMAEVKRSILERATQAVVINGDDELCLQMLPHLQGRQIVLSSFRLTARQLRERTSQQAIIVNLETRQDEEWIVLHEREESIAIIKVNAIPATFNGVAQHNISNAMHAIGAAIALGLNLDSIRKAMGSFEMSFETTPGRLNIHDNGRFHIIMDNAHNADGIRQLVKFTDQYPCQGRKILRFLVSPNATEKAAHAAAAAAAGHFDHYICFCTPAENPAISVDVASSLRQGLISHGVAASEVEILSDPGQSVAYPASLCQPGDLLVLVTSNATLPETWQKILQT